MAEPFPDGVDVTGGSAAAGARILVTEGEQRAALALVRSLGRAGHTVHVSALRPRSLAGASRWARARHVLPDPLDRPGEYAAAVERVVREHRIDLVIPVTEPACLALLPGRDRLRPARILAPDIDTFRRVADKELVMRVAGSVGIGVPGQHVLTGRGADVPWDDMRFPLVLKPARSVGESEGRRVKLGVRYAPDREALRRELAALPDAAFPLLLQQRVVGPGVGVFLLLWEGEVRAVFSHRRLREKPPSGGVSVYRESIPADPELVERSRRLLEGLGWSGVAMVEFKVDERSGTPYLMEINGRFWGSLQLAVDAGVDFPRLAVECALGRVPAPVTTYRTGVRSRWWLGDVDHLLARLRRSPEALALPPGAPGRTRAVADFLLLWRPGDRSEILRFGDPLPALREAVDWLRRR